jgi:hypothetical protein
MDFGLCQDADLSAEALDDAAHERPDAWLSAIWLLGG